MQIEITRNGVAETVEIDPRLDRFTLRETVRLEEALGEALFERLMGSADGDGKVEVPSSPRIIQAIIWSKLASTHPEVGLQDFDLDLSEMALEMGGDDALVIPMTTTDGSEVVGEVALRGNG